MQNRVRWVIVAFVALFAIPGSHAQSSSQQSIPDAPSATKPLPKPSVSPTMPPTAPAAQSEPQQETPGQSDQDNHPGPPPSPNIATVPPGQATKDANTNSRDELFTLTKIVNFVQVPVTIKDERGQLVAGLQPQDFAVLENDEPQRITFFTSDPFPLSAAVVLDVAMSDVAVSRVRETLPALVSAFGQFDEVSIYTYGNTVRRLQGFAPAQNDLVFQTIRKMKEETTGRSGGAPVVGGPLGSGPTINGRPADPGASATVNSNQNPTTYRPESHVLNDAVLAAAQDLATRDRTRRKVLFVISNGRELGSDASYREVLKVLLTQQITVYAVGVEEAAIPGYKQLNKLRIPGLGYGDILPKYAAATGGQVFSEFTRDAIESAYNQVTAEARNQYTIGYVARSNPSSAYRSIEVRVHRPLLKVIARDGYYPLPPAPAK
jgi:VWFA-related protein